jgi:S1-C subfamily serine protease
VIVTMPGGDQLEAKIVGKDYSTGIGLLKIDRTKLASVEVVSSEKCVVGQEAFTVSSMGGEKRCADCGIITYLGPFDAVWEFVLDKCVSVTASSLSIGMSGGPICNLNAQLIGINYLNFADLSRAILGVPGESFLTVRDELVKHGRRTTAAPRAWLGVLSYTLREHVVIAGVMPGGPGEKAGLQQGDLVISIDDTDVNDRRVLYEALANHRPGENVALKVLRNNRVYQLDIPAIRAEDYFA